MGFSSVLESQPLQTHKMKFLIALCLVASAMAIEDTADVAAAKAAFAAAFDSAEKIAALPAPYFYNGYYGGYPYVHGAYPYAAYAHGAYAYGGYPYAGYGYAGYPYVYGLPVAAKEE